jgi:tetratricopeptide (TPR) repeat protein
MVAGFWLPDTVKEYKERIDRTVKVAKSRIKNDVADSYDYFYLGGALGFLGRFELMRAEWLSSFLTAKKAIKALKTCKKMDPNNRDVLLGLGTFDYYTAKLSGVLKFLSYLLLHKGNKQEGLRKLHVAADEAIYSGSEAKSVLLHIYLFLEGDSSKALPLAKDLGEKYGQDPIYKLFEGVACVRLGLWEEYNNILSYMRQRSVEAPSSKESSSWKRRAIYLESIHDLFYDRYPEAREKLGEVLKQSDPENDPAMIAWPIVKIGMAYDLEGNRNEAKKYYYKALSMENGSGAQFMAQKCLDAPPKAKDPIIGY